MLYPRDNSHLGTPPWCTPHNSVHMPTPASRSSTRTDFSGALWCVAIGMTCLHLPPRSSSVCLVRVAECGCTHDTHWRSCSSVISPGPLVDRQGSLSMASWSKSTAWCVRVLTLPWHPTRSGPENTGPPQPCWMPLSSSPCYWWCWDPNTPRIPTSCSGSPGAVWKSSSFRAWVSGWSRAMCPSSTQ